MNENVRRKAGARGRGSYFYLSYAHSPPLAGSPPDDQPDEWVRTFFGDLKEAVQRHASPGSQLKPGFFDQEIPPAPDWKASLTHALGTAEVFVPLYSPDYLKRSWPGREWACFEQRLEAAGVTDPLRRFAPVLWIPIPAGQELGRLPGTVPVTPGPAARAYRENGLRALLRLAPYRSSYEQVVDELAAHIARLAETDSIGPSAVRDIDQIESALQPEADAMVFAVVVAAPSFQDMSGVAGDPLRSFTRDQRVSLAEYARVVAEQLDFAVLVTEIEKVEDLLRYNPGIVLIDPSYIDDEEGRRVFQAFASDLPSWVLPVLVSDPSVPELSAQIRSYLKRARSEPARRALSGVSSLRDFITLMPYLVTQAEREYLRHGPIERSTARLGSRPRLTDDLRPPGPVSSAGNGAPGNAEFSGGEA